MLWIASLWREINLANTSERIDANRKVIFETNYEWCVCVYVYVCKMLFLLLVRFLQRLLGHQVCQAGPHSFADTSAMWWRCPSLSESAQGHVSAQASPPGLDLGTSALAAQTDTEGSLPTHLQENGGLQGTRPAQNSPRGESSPFSALPECNEKG